VPTVAPLLEPQVHGAIAELKRLQPDSMSVVLRPDEKTEVHLHLQLVDGAVEVEAHLQRGDPGALGAEWVQLQQNLSTQGVRLSSLQENSPSQGSLPGGGLPQGGQRDKAPEPEGAPTHRAGVSSPSRPAGPPARPSSPPPAGPGRAWETWA
jgi:hypothetical protein